MRSVLGRDKSSALVLLAASVSLGVLASDVGGVIAEPADGGGPGRLLLAAALAGGVIALLMLLSPGKEHRSLRSMLKADWRQLAGLGALMVVYGLVLDTLGFFLATSLCLAIGSMLLGERRWWPLLVASVPVAAILEVLLLVVFGIAIADPLLRTFGIPA